MEVFLIVFGVVVGITSLIVIFEGFDLSLLHLSVWFVGLILFIYMLKEII